MTDPTAPAAAVGVSVDSWGALRRHTAARIALGRSGASLPTRAALEFELAHAQARDAVLTPLDAGALCAALEADGWTTLRVHSRAPDRAAYLARPDWGRRLDADSATALVAPADPPDLVLVLSDGLSAVALQRHAPPLLRALRPLLPAGLRLGPLVVATQARVALADEVAERLGARVAVSVIGERPGLSSPDSLGLYLTYEPRVGRHDAERNCISNIRPQGLACEAAAQQLAALLQAALNLRCSGVALRFDPAQALPGPSL
ncbi:MAG: ethanolamine ammonia-lyase subunit EutC [Nevskia sp.]|nr:ethanolamine ammonia-lyase subunit EutC [Nevskia sp.]